MPGVFIIPASHSNSGQQWLPREAVRLVAMGTAVLAMISLALMVLATLRTGFRRDSQSLVVVAFDLTVLVACGIELLWG